jgi:protoporphyrinogen oxidase
MKDNLIYDQIVLGAGPSGISYSLFFDNSPLIIEKNDHPGGHASSFVIDGFTFDYGPHIIFSRDKRILDFIVNSLGDNVHQCKRNNKISFKNKLVKYPFENDLSTLDLEDNYECISQFLFNPYKEKYKNPSNMKEWFLHTFGEGISNKYLIPYNEKVWNIPVEKLSMVWSDRIPNPPPEDILKSSIGIKTEGYLHQLYYHYPEKGGYQSISENWSQSCDIHFNEEVVKINKLDNGFEIETSKQTYQSKKIVSTINLSALFKTCAHWIPKYVVEAYKKLIINPMYVISIGIKGNDMDKYTAIYFADKEFLVNRVSYPCTFSEKNGPNNHFIIQAEITYSPQSDIADMTDEAIIQHFLVGLKERSLIDGEVILVDLKRVSESYVVYDVGYENHTKIIRDYFAQVGIDLLGRFSYFEYINIDMAVARSIETYQRISQSTLTKEDLLNKALAKISNIKYQN